MNQENEFAYARGLATLAAQTQIGTPLVLGEMTLAVWEARLAAVLAQKELAQDKESLLDGKRGELDTKLAALVTLGKQIHALAKGKWRNDGTKLGHFRNVDFGKNGRSALLASCCAVESGWEGAEAGWVPVTEPAVPPAAAVPITLALFKARRLAVEELLKQEALAQGLWSEQEKVLNELCRTLNKDNVAWYAAALVLFPEGTPHGDMIRGTIPTTYVPPVDPPGGCGFTHAESAAPGEATVGVAAPGATHYKLWHRGPSDPDWVLVLDNSASGEYSETGLEAGEHRYKGQGFNSGGAGAESEEQTVTVG